MHGSYFFGGGPCWTPRGGGGLGVASPPMDAVDSLLDTQVGLAFGVLQDAPDVGVVSLWRGGGAED